MHEIASYFQKEVRTRKILVFIVCGAVYLGIAGLVTALDKGVHDQDLPAKVRPCMDIVGCHKTPNKYGTIFLSTSANDGDWDTPGESGVITATISIDSTTNADDIAGVMLLDADTEANIKDSNWKIAKDPNSNPLRYNYNEVPEVSEPVDFVWFVDAPLRGGVYRIFGRLMFADLALGWYTDSNILKIVLGTGISEDKNLTHEAQHSELRSCPNPFTHSTRISYQLPTPRHTSLKIYDLSGRLVRTLVNRECTAGAHTVVWDRRDDSGRKTPEGLYFLRLKSGRFVSAGKTVVLR